MRHHLRLSVLLPVLASVAACGGATDDSTPSPGSSSSSSSSSSSGGASSSSSGGASSSSSSGSPSDGGVAAYDQSICTGSQYKPLDGVTLAPSIDYLELRQAPDVNGNPPPTPTIVGTAGTECATASNKPACTQKVTDATSPGWEMSFGGGGLVPAEHRYGVTTKADTVATIGDPAGIAVAIAPIDTAKDAALLVMLKGDNYTDCSKNNARKTATGWEIVVEYGYSCGVGSGTYARTYAVTTDGTVTLTDQTLIQAGSPGCATGRRPEGLADVAASDACDPVGAFFAAVAHLEAASVFSFERLANELDALGAPPSLIGAAWESREDEVSHARMTTKIAKKHGGTPADVMVAPHAPRSAFAIALENATEGCVRETYGALLAHRQALGASDPTIRCMMQVIAEDETRHAGLAWDVAAWLEPQLSSDERELVNEARRRAIADLRVELAADPHPDLRTRAGMPGAVEAISLLDSLDHAFLGTA
jgi:hypothetical protein